MTDYRQGSHTRYSLKIHLVFVTKYRKRALHGAIAKRLRELIREICLANEIQIIKGHVSRDHVHLLLSYPPRLSESKIAQYIKGKSSRKLLQEYSDLKRTFWGQHLWARGYFAVSTGNISDKVIEEYISNQDKDNDMRDDDFQISG